MYSPWNVSHGGREARLESLGMFEVVRAVEIIFFLIIRSPLHKFLLVVCICED